MSLPCEQGISRWEHAIIPRSPMIEATIADDRELRRMAERMPDDPSRKELDAFILAYVAHKIGRSKDDKWGIALAIPDRREFRLALKRFRPLAKVIDFRAVHLQRMTRGLAAELSGS